MNHAADCSEGKARSALATALRIGLGWWTQAAPDSRQRQEIAGLRHYIGGRLVAGDWSPKTLNTVGVMFCLTCRKTHPGLSSICAGRPLLECVLIAGE